jgi:AcrR family transcriptional regulator
MDPGADRETRDKILDAAHAIFVRQGTVKTRTVDIAAESGVNKALLHYYFGSKSALADAVFERAAGSLFPRIFKILADENRSIEDKVRDVVEEQIQFHSAHPYLAAYVASELHTDPDRVTRVFEKRGTAPLTVLRRQLRDGAERGTLRPIGAEQFIISMMALLVFPFVMWPAMRLLLGYGENDLPAVLEERKRTLPEFILAGLRP